MRIGVNTRLLIADRMEGIPRYCFETTRRMVLAHPEDEFFFFFDRTYDPNFKFADNVTPVILQPQARHPLLWYWWFEKSVTKALIKYKCDVLFSPEIYLSLSSKVPALIVSHDIAYIHYPEHLPWGVKKYYQRYMPKYHAHAKHIVSVSQTSKQDVIDQYGIDGSNITVAYNGCSEEFVPIHEEEKVKVRNQFSDGKPYFIYVGSIHPRKNISRLIEAFDQHYEKDQSHHLLLVGRWAWKTNEIQNTLSKTKNRDAIKVISNHVSSVAPLIAAAKSMVYVSLLEGFGLPILEAMCCDVPVITSNKSSMAEIAGPAALKVDPNKINEISDAFAKMIKDDNLQKQLISEGRKQREKFNWDESAKTIYEQLSKL